MQPRSRILLLLAGVALVGGASFLGGRFVGSREALNRALDPPAMVREIQRLSELVSVKYTLQKVCGIDVPKVPIGSERILLFAQAEVLAGVDLQKLQAANVTVLPGHQARIVLPPPAILHIVIDDKQSRVWDHRVTWWTPWVPYDQDLERRARLQATEEMRSAALQMGILDQAKRNAEQAIRGLLGTLGIGTVTFGG